MCKIVVDTNAAENFIYEACTDANVYVERKRLDVGDIIIYNESITFILERKTWSDLTASICDGRWNEQKSRMLHESTVKYGYIIEGNLPSWEKNDSMRMNPVALWGALLKTQIRDEMYVFHTDSKYSTSQLILYLYKQLKSSGFEVKKSNIISGIGFKRKRDNLNDSHNVLTAMLTVIPGMSKAKSQAVVCTYPSVTDLSQCTIQDLSNVQCGNKKLGSSLASVIYDIFGNKKKDNV